MKTKIDSSLQHRVLAELEWDPSLDASKVGVTADEGVVTLAGTVKRFYDKMLAERATKRVYGVKAVANDIQIDLPGAENQSDSDLAAAAVNALAWNASVPEDAIVVTVRDGFVTLEGSVNWNHQRDSAEHAVRILKGVKGVTNKVAVKGQVACADVAQRIEAAFKRSAEIDAQRVHVEAHGGKIVLQGTVRSCAERDEAQRAAWAAPGVTAVENDIKVAP